MKCLASWRGEKDRAMADMEVIESLDNAWRTLARQYTKYPDEGIRCGMNLLAKVIAKVRSEVEESHREKQIFPEIFGGNFITAVQNLADFNDFTGQLVCGEV